MKRTIIALIAALTLITVGLILGQQNSVLMKAINVCLECVGIG